MSNDEKMTIDERRKYLRLVKPHYRKAGRKEKGGDDNGSEKTHAGRET